MKRRAGASCVCVFLTLACVFSLRISAFAVTAPVNSSEIHIPSGVAIAVDGVKSAREWDDAAMTQFAVAPGWSVRVFAKHDAQYLDFDFEGVTHAGNRLFPEILLDPHNTRSQEWQKGQWWLHISNKLCEWNGGPNVYESKSKFQWGLRKPGWDANNLPDDHTELIEVKISFAKLGVAYAPGMKVGLAFDITDASGNVAQNWYFWPASAKIESPKTWGVAVLE
jgi:hypothetical protein